MVCGYAEKYNQNFLVELVGTVFLLLLADDPRLA